MCFPNNIKFMNAAIPLPIRRLHRGFPPRRELQMMIYCITEIKLNIWANGVKRFYLLIGPYDWETTKSFPFGWLIRIPR